MTITENQDDLMVSLKVLQDLDLGLFIDELRKLDLKKVKEYFELMERNPSISGLTEDVLKQVIKALFLWYTQKKPIGAVGKAKN